MTSQQDLVDFCITDFVVNNPDVFRSDGEQVFDLSYGQLLTGYVGKDRVKQRWHCTGLPLNGNSKHVLKFRSEVTLLIRNQEMEKTHVSRALVRRNKNDEMKKFIKENLKDGIVFVYVHDENNRIQCTLCFKLPEVKNDRIPSIVNVSASWTHPSEKSPTLLEGRYSSLMRYVNGAYIPMRLAEPGNYSRQLKAMFSSIISGDYLELLDETEV